MELDQLSEMKPIPQVQLDELDALEAIFMDDMSQTRNPDHSLRVTISFPVEALGTRFCLEFSLPPKYPEVPPVVRCSHALSVATWANDEGLLAFLKAKAESSLHSAMIFALVSEAQEWIDRRLDGDGTNPTPDPTPNASHSETLEPAPVPAAAATPSAPAPQPTDLSPKPSTVVTAAGCVDLNFFHVTSAAPPCLERSTSRSSVLLQRRKPSSTTLKRSVVPRKPEPTPLCRRSVTAAPPTESTNVSRVTRVGSVFPSPVFPASRMIENSDSVEFHPLVQQLFHSEAAAAIKLKVTPRCACLSCGQLFPSRAKLFSHLQDKPHHDTTPGVVEWVLVLTLNGDLHRASHELYGTPARPISLIATMLWLSLEKLRECRGSELLDAAAQVCQRLVAVADSWDTKLDLTPVAALRRTLIALEAMESVGVDNEEHSQVCTDCNKLVISLASHRQRLRTCGHVVCEGVLKAAAQKQANAKTRCPLCNTPVESEEVGLQIARPSFGTKWFYLPTGDSQWAPFSPSDNASLESAYRIRVDCTKLPIHARAVSLSALLRFTGEHARVLVDGVSRNIMDLTTSEVVSNVILPTCRSRGVMRYAELIAQDYGRDQVGLVTVFVSHVWANKWGLLVKMLSSAFDVKRCQALNVYFWIDVFAICQTQHCIEKGVLKVSDEPKFLEANEEDVRLFETPHAYAVRTFGAMDSDSMTNTTSNICHRAWCLFEFATTLHRGNVLSFRMGSLRTCGTSLRNALQSNTPSMFVFDDGHVITLANKRKFELAVRGIDVKMAKSAVQRDLTEVIHPRIRQLGNGNLSHGFSMVNSTVRQAIEQVRELEQWQDNELSYAAFQGAVDRLVKLLRSGDCPNQADKSGKTPLHRACTSGSAACVQALIANGANLLLQDNKGLTPLHTAAQRGNVECIQTIVQSLESPTTEGVPHLLTVVTSDGTSPLFMAIFNGDPEPVEAIISAWPCNMATKDRSGRTALHFAALHGKSKVLQVLLRHLPKVPAALLYVDTRDAQGNTPLHYAGGGGYETCIRILLAAGAQPQLQNSQSRTCVDVAARWSRCAALFNTKTHETALSVTAE